jgi:hypothetical protein
VHFYSFEGPDVPLAAGIVNSAVPLDRVIFRDGNERVRGLVFVASLNDEGGDFVGCILQGKAACEAPVRGPADDCRRVHSGEITETGLEEASIMVSDRGRGPNGQPPNAAISSEAHGGNASICQSRSCSHYYRPRVGGRITSPGS